MVVIYSGSYGELHIRNKLWKLQLQELKKVKYFVGYDKGESREIENEQESVKKIVVTLSHIFLSLRPPSIQSKLVEAPPPLFLTHAPPPSHY